MLKKSVSLLLLLTLLLPLLCISSPKAEAASYTAAQWKTLTDRFHVFLCGTTDNDMNNSAVKTIVTKIDNNAATYWNKLKEMRTAGVTNGLFDQSIDNPNEMGWQYIYLWYMAQAYGTYGSKYYQNADLLNDIIYGIRIMEQKFYTATALKAAQSNMATFNWWDWAYNAPMHLCRTLLAIRPSLTAAAVSAQGYSSVKTFIYNQVSRCETMITTVKPITGISNATVLTENRRVRLLSWVMLASLRGAQASSTAELTTAANMMTECHTALTDFLKNASNGAEGVNPDGSYICHTYFSMEGTYGLEVIVDRLIPAFTVLAGTPFEPTSANNEILADWMLTTFRDVTRNGVLLSMNIGRYQDSGVSKGVMLVKGALQLLDCFGPTKELQLRQMIKDMVPQNRYSSYANNLGDVNMVQTLYRVVYDDTVALREEEYAVMRYTTDRAIQHTDKYTVGLAMSSTRISTHDCTNGRNRYGWYTGDGMVYVYPDRTSYGYDPYGTSFYKYANMYRIPGTTEENSTRRSPNSIRNHYLPRTDFVGGAELEDQFIAAAFDFDAYTWSSSESSTYDNFTPGTNGQNQKRQVLTSDLEAQKAYFMFDDEIVCVGNGINYSTNSNTINTYVNNMELRETATVNGASVVGTEDIVVDGTLLEKAASYSKTYTNPKWVYQEAFGGYYFPSNASVTLNKTARSTVNDYNLDSSGKSTVTADGKTHSFLELWVNHGSKPSGGTYSYVMLPEKTQSEVRSYASSPEVSILSNSTSVTVVKEKTLGITAYVFWKAGTYGDITVNQPMILMVREHNGSYNVAVSDPSHKLSSATVTIKRGLNHVSSDSKITVKNAASSTTLTVNFSGSYDKSYSAAFTVGQDPYLFFDFTNLTADKRRYTNTVYQGYNFDTAGWKINTNYVSSQSYNNNDIGTTAITMISGKNNPYLQTIGSTDSFNATPLNYKPSTADVAVLRFKLQNCALVSGAATPQLRLYYIKNGVTTGVVNSDYISANFSASALNSNKYITVVIPTNAAFRGASSINAIRPVFFNVTSASGKNGVITLDSIYVGPAQNTSLYFDFRNDGAAQKSYSDSIYDGNNYDTGSWCFNSSRLDSLRYEGSGLGTLTLYLQEGGTAPYIQTTDHTKSFTANAMQFTPASAEVAVIRFKMKGCTPIDPTANATVRFTYGKNNEGADLASSQAFSAAIPTAALNSGEYLTLVVPVNADFKAAELIHALRICFNNVTHLSGAVGEIVLDYVFVGPRMAAPDLLYFDFTNDAAAKLRYRSSLYGGTNFDQVGSWWINTNYESAATMGSGAISFSSKNVADRTAHYVQTGSGTSDLPLHFVPGKADYCQIKIKIDNSKCSQTNGKAAFHMYYNLNDPSETAAAVVEFPLATYNNKGFFTLTFPMNAANYSKLREINDLRPQFSRILSADGATAAFAIDYIYIGPKDALPLPLYDVTFKNADGTVLQTQTVQKGSTVTYTGATPTKAYDATNHYSFKGWDKALTNITANTTFTAQYTPTAHSYSYAKVDNSNHKATCSCGYSKTAAHSWNSGTVTTQPTCTAVGVKTYTCTTCKATKTEAVAALGHSYTTKVTAPTCTAQGYTTHTCSRCSDSYQDTYTNALGHSYSYKVTWAPTLWTAGTLTGTCSRCSATTTVTLPKLNTTDYTKTVTKAPTCTTTGTDSYKWKTTTYGSFSFTASSEILGHSIVNGYCSTCGCKYTGTLLDFKAGSPEISYIWNVLRHCDKPAFDTAGKGFMKGNISAPGGEVRTDIYVGMQAGSNPNNLKHKLLTADEIFQVRFKLNLDISIPTNSRTKLYLKTDDVTDATGYSETYQVYTDSVTTDSEGYSIATMKIPSTLVGRTIETVRVDFIDLIGFVATEGSYAIDYIYMGPGCQAPNKLHTWNSGAITTQPTCTAAGVKTYTCTLCRTTKTEAVAALGHSYTTKVTAPTCTDRGYTTHTCSRCSNSYKDTYVAAKGHSEVIDKAVAATCTTSGKTEGKHCSVCNAVLVAQQTVPATGHSYIYTKIDGLTHRVTCKNCSYSASAAHSYKEGYCLCGEPEIKEPVEDVSLKLNHSLNLASDISVNLLVSKTLLEGFDLSTVYVESTLSLYDGNGQTGTATLRMEPVENGNYYYFTLKGLTAVQMNDSISSVLYGTKNGQPYFSPVDEYSIAAYAYSQLNNPDRPEKLKILCADLLRYGSYAQRFKAYRTDALADAPMTDTHKAYLSNMESVPFGNTNRILSDLPDPTITWVGKALDLQSKVTLKFIFSTANYTGSLSDLRLHVTYTDLSGKTVTAIVTELEAYAPEENRYAFSFSGLLAAELRSVVSVQIYEGNTPVSPSLQYSADTYGANKEGILLTLCKALFAYSDSAKAYFQT